MFFEQDKWHRVQIIVKVVTTTVNLCVSDYPYKLHSVLIFQTPTLRVQAIVFTIAERKALNRGSILAIPVYICMYILGSHA